MKTLTGKTEAEILELPADARLDRLVEEAMGTGGGTFPIEYSSDNIFLGEMLEWLDSQQMDYEIEANHYLNEPMLISMLVFPAQVGGKSIMISSSRISHAVALAVAVLGKRQLSSKA